MSLPKMRNANVNRGYRVDGDTSRSGYQECPAHIPDEQLHGTVFDSIEQRLAGIRERDLYRTLFPYEGAQGVRLQIHGQTYHNFSSNDYLGLANHPAVVEAFKRGVAAHGLGTGASPLICGHHEAHAKLQHAVAAMKKKPAALVLNSGYQANVGILSALCAAEGVTFSDELNHASIIDGCRLGRARSVVYRHRDVNDLEDKMSRFTDVEFKVVVTDGLFSVDGDLAPLRELVGLCEQYGALLYIDEAHSGGVFGDHGGGLVEELGIDSPLVISFGTFSKAFGASGSYLAAEIPIVDLMINTCRSFIYSTAFPPAIAEACLEAIRVVQTDLERRERLWRNVAFLNDSFARRGLPVHAESQVVAYPVGPAADAMGLMAYLKQQGFLVVAIRPPTVPEGGSRLRISLTSEHEPDVIERLVELLATYPVTSTRGAPLNDR